MKRLKGFLIFIFLILSTGVSSFGQSGRVNQRTASDNDALKVVTEEIRINVSASTVFGDFVKDIRKEDLVISENDVLHQASSVRRSSPNIILIMDTGGESRQAKDFKTTQETAKALIKTLAEDDTIALIEVNDRATILTEWTSDKTVLFSAIDKQLKFGIRSRFVDALRLARTFFLKADAENRHLVLITDGLESVRGEIERDAAMKRFLETDISVHVVSYTKMEQAVVSERRRSVSAGDRRPAPPPGAGVPVQGQTRPTSVATVNLDRAMVRKINERGFALAASEKALNSLTENTNGELILPESRQEMIEAMEGLAKLIDSYFVVTYVPKRQLEDAKEGEERNIEVTSRISALRLQGKRKLIVRKDRTR
jgi:hypothetical protein